MQALPLAAADKMKNEECRNNVRRPEGKPIIQFRVYCPKESKCHALARFVLFVRLVFEKTFAYIKLNTNLPLIK